MNGSLKNVEKLAQTSRHSVASNQSQCDRAPLRERPQSLPGRADLDPLPCPWQSQGQRHHPLSSQCASEDSAVQY
jgi:hypothetical protein